MLLICKNVEREAEGAAVKKLIDEGLFLLRLRLLSQLQSRTLRLTASQLKI